MNNRFCCINHLLDRNKTGHNLYLDLWKKIHIHLNTPVIGGGTFLDSAALCLQIHGIMAVKAGFAQRQVPRHGLQVPGVHITQGIGTDHSADLISCVGRSN